MRLEDEGRVWVLNDGGRDVDLFGGRFEVVRQLEDGKRTQGDQGSS